MMRRCVIVCLLAGPVLGGCGNYALKQEVESQFGKPNMVQYVSGDKFAYTLYGKSKPFGLGKTDQEIWYYIYRQFVVIFHDDQYTTRPLTVWELLNSQRIFNDLYRRDNRPRDVQFDSENPRVEKYDPGKISRPEDNPADLPPTRDPKIPDLPGWQ